MKRSIVSAIVGICVSSSLAAFDYVISDTYEYTTVSLNNESLLVTGAGAFAIRANGSSYVAVERTAPLKVDVGGISSLTLDDTSAAEIWGGELGSLRMYKNTTATLEGGRVDHISSYQYILGPNQTYLPHIELIVRDWAYNSQTKILSGVWNVDNNSDTLFDTFTIQLHNQTGYDPVIDNIKFTIIPEPATLLLFGAAGLLLRRNPRA